MMLTIMRDSWRWGSPAARPDEQSPIWLLSSTRYGALEDHARHVPLPANVEKVLAACERGLSRPPSIWPWVVQATCRGAYRAGRRTRGPTGS